MSTWKRATSEPLTTEREVRVYNTETGEEGYIHVTRECTRDHSPHFFGPVSRLDRVFDAFGTEIEEPTRTVLDANPTIA
jgi:hypothetical protein